MTATSPDGEGDDHMDMKDVKLNMDTGSEMTEEFDLGPEMLDVKPMDLRLTPGLDLLEHDIESTLDFFSQSEVTESSNQTQELTVIRTV